MNRILAACVVTFFASQTAGCDDAVVGGDSAELGTDDACRRRGSCVPGR